MSMRVLRRIAAALLLASTPAMADGPVFTRAGGVAAPGPHPAWSIGADGTALLGNLTLSGGLYNDPLEATASFGSPTTECSGNGGPDAPPTSTGLAYGAICVHLTSPTDSFGPLQTYAMQVGITYPAQAAQKSYPARDQVALYPEARANAFGPAMWAENPLAQANRDASSVIVSEMDLNNLSGCDSPGINSNTTGGSAGFVANRSDGSPCSPKIGLLVTGVATNTSSAGINFSYVSDGQHAMWQDGIRMLGGYMAAENEWVSDTQAPTAFKIKGVHGYDGFGLESGQFGEAAVSLSAQSATNGRILWHCPDSGCVAGNGYPTSASIQPQSDGALHVSAVPLAVDGALSSGATTTVAANVPSGTSGLIVGTPPVSPTIMSGVYAPVGWSTNVAEWYAGAAELGYLSSAGTLTLAARAGGLFVQGGTTFASLATLQGGASSSNYILQGGGSYIFDNSAGTAAVTISYDQANTAIMLSAPGVEISGSAQVAGSASVSGNLKVTGTSHFIGTETHDSLLSANGGVSGSNYILQKGGSYIFDDSNGNAQATIGYDQPNTAIMLSAPGVEVSGTEKVGGNLVVAGSVQMGSLPTAALPANCLPGTQFYDTDGRKGGEAAGAGSGVPVICTPSSKGGPTVWYSMFSGAVVLN